MAKGTKTGNKSKPAGKRLAPPPLIPNDPGPNLGATGSPGYSDPLNLPTGQYGVFGNGWNSPYPIVPPLPTGDYGIFGDAPPTNLPPLQGHLPASSAGSPRAMLPYGAALPLPPAPMGMGPDAGDAQWVSPPNGPQQWQGGPAAGLTNVPATGWGGLDALGPRPTGYGGLEGVPQLPPMIPKTPLEQYVAAIEAAKAGGSTYTGHNYVPPPMPATGWGGLDSGPPATHPQQWQGTGPLQRGPQQWQGTGSSAVKPPATAGGGAHGGMPPVAPGTLNNGRQGMGMSTYLQMQNQVGSSAPDLFGIQGDPFKGASPAQVAAFAAYKDAVDNGTIDPATGKTKTSSGSNGSSGPSRAQIGAAHQSVNDQYNQLLQRYADAGTQLTGLNNQAGARQADIMSGLNTGAAAARGATAAAYQAGDARLNDLLGQYTAQQAQQTHGLNQMTDAFGAPRAAGPSGAVNDLYAADRARNSMLGTAADTMYANRGNVYNALGADASMARGNTFDALMQKLQAQKQQAAADQARANADLSMKYGG